MKDIISSYRILYLLPLLLFCSVTFASQLESIHHRHRHHHVKHPYHKHAHPTKHAKPKGTERKRKSHLQR